MALAANAASMAKMHDSGRTVDPSRDISHHYRPHKGYSGSHHGGSLYAEVGGSLHSQQSGGGSTHKKKNLPRNYSEGALARAQSSGHNQKVNNLLQTQWLLLLHFLVVDRYQLACCQSKCTVCFNLEQSKLVP